jgi:hypothetical protein
MRILCCTLRIFAPIALLSIFSISSAISRSNCTDIDRIAREALHGFVALRGPYDSTFDEYKGTISLGTLTACSTSQGQDGVSTYQCESDTIPDDQVLAVKEFTRVNNEVKACLGKKVREARHSDNAFVYELIARHDVLTVQYYRVATVAGSPAFYRISFEYAVSGRR